MKTYFVKDIDRRFTEVIGDYIAKGYILFSNTMGGSQGEMAKVHLINPERTHLVNIRLESFNSWKENVEGVKIIVRKCGMMGVIPASKSDTGEEQTYRRFNPNDYTSMSTLWNDDGEEVSCETFYKIDSHRNNFYGDMEALENARKKRAGRPYRYSLTEKHVEKNVTSPKTVDMVYPWVKRQYKCTSTLKKEIKDVIKCTDTDVNRKTKKVTTKSYYKIALPNYKFLYLGKLAK